MTAERRPIAGDAGPPATRGRRLEAPHRRLDASARRGGRRVRIVERAAVAAYRATAALLARLPERLSVAVLGRLLELSYLAWPAKRAQSNGNFAHVLGTSPSDPGVRRLALAAYRTYARYLVELMRLPSRPVAELRDRVELRGIEGALEEWRTSGRGLILTVGHVGNNEACAAGIAESGFPIAAVADDSAFPELFEHLRRQREAWGIKLIPWRNLRELFGVLRRNEILALLIDWGYRDDGVPVTLFGDWTCLPAGPAVLAAKTGAPIVPVTVRRARDGRFLLSTEAPISVGSTSPAEVQAATQALADALERTIAAAPEQWYSFKPMWPATDAEAAALERRAAEMRATAT